MSVSPAGLLQTVFRHRERMVGRRIADEYILVPIAGRGADVDALFTLNRVGTFIWEHIDGVRTGRDIVDGLVRQFEVDRAQAEEDYMVFLEQLLSIRAVEPADKR